MKINYILFIVVYLLTLSCSPEKKTPNAEALEEISSEEQVVDQIAGKNDSALNGEPALDTLLIKTIIEELSEIEKYTIHDNIDILASLLKFKQDMDMYEKIEVLLKKDDDYIEEYEIEILDTKNGYIRYTPIHAEVTFTKVYWNLEDASKLIITEIFGCGPICDSNLKIEKFKDGMYEELESSQIIPDIAELPGMLVPDYEEGPDPVEFKFELPRNGKNIQFCDGDNCIELHWAVGIFEIRDNS